jgi:hypothetical protein
MDGLRVAGVSCCFIAADRAGTGADADQRLRFSHEAVVVFMVLSIPARPSGGDRQIASPLAALDFLVRRALVFSRTVCLFRCPPFLRRGIKNGFTGQGKFGRIRICLLAWHAVAPGHASELDPGVEHFGQPDPVERRHRMVVFLFILVLVPLWRRRGVLVAVATGMAASLLPALMVWAGAPTPAGFPHLVGAFVLGMAGAAIFAGRSPGDDRRRPTGLTLAGWLSLLAFAYVTLHRSDIRLDDTRRWFSDMLVATSATAAIIALAAPAGARVKPRSASEVAAWALQVPPIRFLGRVSYSLYLTHLVLWAILGITLNLAPIKAVLPFSLDPMAARVFVLIPAQLGIAYISYRLFERPFLRGAVTGPSPSPRLLRPALAGWLRGGGLIRRRPRPEVSKVMADTLPRDGAT